MKKIFSFLGVIFFAFLFLPSFALAFPGPLSGGLDISAQVAGVSTVPPTVVTDALSTVGMTTATLLGTLTDAGDSGVTTEGFNYGTDASYGLMTTSSGAFGIGDFSATVSGLSCGTTYHYEAYATNGAGTSTGADETFATDACPIVPPPVPSPSAGGHGALATSSTVNFSGTTSPGATVTILEDGVAIVSAVAKADGTFVATVAGIDGGAYVFSAYAKDSAGDVSPLSSFPFVIDSRSIVNIGGIVLAIKASATPPGACSALRADLNCDGRVDIVDFSIMKYWYDKPDPPARVDLSGDGMVTLKDFSILAAEWTG